jgi:hypothetical protein
MERKLIAVGIGREQRPLWVRPVANIEPANHKRPLCANSGHHNEFELR